MEHKGIEYTVRARPGANQWLWTILPKDRAPIASAFEGSRRDATADACRAIDRWLERHARTIDEARTIDKAD
jgi:hypothetical protein